MNKQKCEHSYTSYFPKKLVIAKVGKEGNWGRRSRWDEERKTKADDARAHLPRERYVCQSFSQERMVAEKKEEKKKEKQPVCARHSLHFYSDSVKRKQRHDSVIIRRRPSPPLLHNKPQEESGVGVSSCKEKEEPSRIEDAAVFVCLL